MRTPKRAVGVVTVLVVALVAGVLATAVDRGNGSSSASGSVAARKSYDLVWISDSVGWGVASFYARHVRQALGVTVRVHDRWEGSLPAAVVLERLRTPGHPWIGLIRNAEVIFVLGNPVGVQVVRGGDCVTTGCQKPSLVGPQVWTKYIATMKAIYKRIFEIRDGKAVILRTSNWYVPIANWNSCSIADICTKKWKWLSWAVAKAASAYRVPVADLYAAFNGKSHREDAVAKGYIGPDGMHANNKGRAVIAKTLATLGYKPVKPPK